MLHQERKKKKGFTFLFPSFLLGVGRHPSSLHYIYVFGNALSLGRMFRKFPFPAAIEKYPRKRDFILEVAAAAVSLPDPQPESVDVILFTSNSPAENALYFRSLSGIILRRRLRRFGLHIQSLFQIFCMLG
ncbi:hypothetical protein CDAR_373631 [Caerostris darwini]|uniref:Uncharacterized protein n=1 Tax=Caerostris darwini TaxID=1538125 RepID=A0AAV4QL63_9ARAC|nr:hypothetical protein CDAR_373631 [Caerostris darwini]